MINDDGTANDPFSSYLRSSQQRDQRNGGGQRSHNRDNYRNNERNNRNNNRQNGGGRFGGNRRNGPPATAEDLNKEMDEWRMQVDDGNNKPADGELDI